MGVPPANHGGQEMERLFFICPDTRRTVDVGVATEIGTLLRIKSETLRARCRACGNRRLDLIRFN
jgi:hypothetical protein